MTVSPGFCNIFKTELLRGNHDFENDVIKVALYGEDVVLDRNVTNYFTQNELTAAGYSAGGETITITLAMRNGSSFIDAQNVIWTNLISRDVEGALVYNSSRTTNNAIAIYDTDHSVVQGSYTINFSRKPLLSIT